MNEDLNRPAGRYFEELPVGTVIRHRVTRTVTESDNILFTTLTMNPQPLHLDFEAAAASEFGRPLFNSMMTLSLIVGLSVHELSLGTLVDNLGLTDVVFPKPVFHGDTLFAETEVLEKKPSRSKPDRGTVKVHTRVLNQDGTLVAEFKRLVLVPKKNPGT